MEEEQVVSENSSNTPIQTFQEKIKGIDWHHIFNLTSWMLLIVLAPFTFLFLISQSSLPGDSLYPVKRGLENVVLAAASVNPTTRAIFKTDLTEKRFNEAEKLLLAKKDVAGLSDFIVEIQETQEALTQVTDPVKKEELTQKLIASIDEYQNRLTQVQVQIETVPPSITPTQEVTQQQPEPTTIQPTAKPSQNTQVSTTSIPTQPQQTIIPTHILPTGRPTEVARPTQQQISITQIPTLVLGPSVTPTSQQGGNLNDTINQTQRDLDRIRRELRERRRNSSMQEQTSAGLREQQEGKTMEKEKQEKMLKKIQEEKNKLDQ